MKQGQNRSIYSLNTQKSNIVFNNLNSKANHLASSHPNYTLNELSPMDQVNSLQSLFYQLLQQYATQYPYLSRIIYLQLLLRQNIMILSMRRQQIKEIWKKICKKLLQPRPNIFVIDQTTSIDQILNIKSDYNLALVFDISKLNNFGLNKLLNHDSELSILAVESPEYFDDKKSKNSTYEQLKSVFSICFVDQKEQNFNEMINKLNLKFSTNIFSKDKLHEMIRSNFQMAVQAQNNLQSAKSQSAFFKPYLVLLKEYFKSLQIEVAHSKWKKMAKILQFIAVSKHESVYKKMSLADCCLAGNFLGSSKKQLQEISKANELSIVELVKYYGKQKFLSHLQNHFWIPESMRQYYNSLVEKSENRISFFYPCSKYPQTAKIEIEDRQAFYRIKGYEKKLMSDKYIEIEEVSKAQYELRLFYRSKSKTVVHFGLACFDEYKNPISPVQVCRKIDSAIRIRSIQGNKIFPTQETMKNLKNWNFLKDNTETFAYERCIGIYSNGNTSIMPPVSLILSSSKPYSRQEGIYTNVTDQYIQLSKQGVQKMRQKVYTINENTVLVNHIEQGSYVICNSLNSSEADWKQVRAKIEDRSWGNLGGSFLYGTRYVRLLAMLNYNSGHPDYFIENKQAQIDFKEVCFTPLK